MACCLSLIGPSAKAAESKDENSSAPKTLNALEFVEIPKLGDAALSPDGKQVIVVRSSADWSANKHVDSYQLIDTQTGATTDIPKWKQKGSSLSPGVWSPDSRGFLTLQERKGDKKDSAYFYDVASGELSKVAEHDEDIRDVAWADEGDAFFFRARRHDPRPRKKKRLEIKPYDVSVPYELWKYSLVQSKAKPLLAGDFSVRDYSLSDDGSQILFSRMPEGAQYDSHHRELWLLDRGTGESRQLTGNGYRESDAKLSPDNSQFAFIATVNERGEGYYEDNLFVQKVGAPKPRLLVADEPMEVVDFEWNADGKSIFLLGNIGLRTELFSLDLTSEKLTRLTQDEHVISDWRYDPKSGRHIARIVDAHSPGEIYVKPARDKPFRKISSEYDQWKQQVRLPKQTTFKWTARDGTEIEGLLIKPVGYKPGTRYPLVTTTHGGPRSSSQFGSWNMSRYVAVLAGQGYAILLPNHRGGTGYGDAFMRDMVGNYFRNSHLDVMDGVEALIAEGLADPDRLLKMGWSAGGHMTNKLITFTDRFKAASSGAGASSWISMYAESDVRHNRTPWFGGAPWQEDAPLESYLAQSPLKDAWRVTTPTLFFNGGSDVRVPPTQQIMMYRGVRAAGVPTRLYVARGEPHGFRKPSNQLFKINTELAWFAKHALGQEYDPVLPVIEEKPDTDDTPDEAEEEAQVTQEEQAASTGAAQ